MRAQQHRQLSTMVTNRSALVAVFVVSMFTGPAHFAALNVRTDSEVQITEGSVALLLCSFDCSPNSDNATTVEWSRVSDGSKLLVKNGNDFKPHPRMEWADNKSNCNATIRINDAETGDSDSYRCKVIRQPSNDQGFSVVRLRVSETRVLVVRAPEEVTAVQGDTALLPCSYFCGVKGNNDTLVEWYKTINGEKKKIYKIELRSLNEPRVKWMGDESKCDASISMSNIQNDDSGPYHCEVTLLSFLKQGSKTLQLRVQEAAPDPVPSTTTTPTTTPTITPTSGGLNAGGIAGVSIAAVIGVAAAAIGVYCWMSRRDRPPEEVVQDHELQPMAPAEGGGAAEREEERDRVPGQRENGQLAVGDIVLNDDVSEA
ncbi:uncharacterized protein LOC144738329 isoform X3 [Lampetra planeri]